MTPAAQSPQPITRKTRRRRRLILAAAYTLLAAGILTAAWPARAQATASASAAADARSHFQKARDLYQQGKYAEAQEENKQALALDPANSQAVLLGKVLADKIAAAGAGSDSDAKTSTPTGLPVLNNQQISAIRLAELSASDHNIRGKIDRATLEDFWQNVLAKDPNNPTSPDAKAAFINPGNFAAQVRAIRQSANPRYTNQISISSDPTDIVGQPYSFQHVQTYMLQNCATAECHAGEKAGDFRLIPMGVSGVTVDQQRYTNFYIMSSYSHGGQAMIDRDNPEKSLFIAYSLAKGHPTVAIPTKLASGDTQYRRMVDWIKSLAFPQPNYGISYKLPGESPDSPPATAPAH